MDTLNKKAWELLLESLDNQQFEIVRLQEREIHLLKLIMKLEKKNRNLISVFADKQFKKVKKKE